MRAGYVRAGLPAEDAVEHVVVRALGMGSDVDRYVRAEPWTRGDRVILCSEAITESLAEDGLARLVSTHLEQPEAFVAAACDGLRTANAAVAIIE